MPTNYHITLSATTDVQFLFRYTTYYSSSSDWSYYNGFEITGAGVSRFWLQTYSSNWQDIAYFDFVPYTEPVALTITNRYKAAGRQTVLDLSFNCNIDAYSGD